MAVSVHGESSKPRWWWQQLQEKQKPANQLTINGITYVYKASLPVKSKIMIGRGNVPLSHSKDEVRSSMLLYGNAFVRAEGGSTFLKPMGS